MAGRTLSEPAQNWVRILRCTQDYTPVHQPRPAGSQALWQLNTVGKAHIVTCYLKRKMQTCLLQPVHSFPSGWKGGAVTAIFRLLPLLLTRTFT